MNKIINDGRGGSKSVPKQDFIARSEKYGHYLAFVPWHDPQQFRPNPPLLIEVDHFLTVSLQKRKEE